MRRHLKLGSDAASEPKLVTYDDSESHHAADDPAGTAQGIHDGVALIRQYAHGPQQESVAWTVAFGSADTLAEAARDCEIAAATARTLALRMRRRRSA
jgi:hypothetical protein